MNKEIREKLSAKFRPDEIEWRIMQCGKKGVTGEVWAKAVAYVTNRAIMNRLDDTFGIFNWKNEYKEWHGDSQLCGISARETKDSEWITKWDGADQTQFEGTKGGLSDSMKRAGYQWDIGRYLYQLEETFVKTSLDKIVNWNYESAKKYKNNEGKWVEKCPQFYWEIPNLPLWAYPEGYEPDKSVEKELQKFKEKNKAKQFDEETGKKIKKIAMGKNNSQKSWREFVEACYERYPECNDSMSNVFADHGKDILKELETGGLDKFLSDMPF